MKSQFPLKLITLSVLTALSATAVAADGQGGTSPAATSPSDGYTQGDGEFATIPKGTKVEKTDTAANPANPSDKVAGELNRLGNPVRIIWYGRKGDKDGETPQKGAINNGQIFGSVRATGVDNVGGKDNHNASVQVEGQGNAIDALGWSSYRNKRGVTYALDKIDNNGTAQGEARLQGALADVNGDVTGFVAGNGISVVGTADFGKVSAVSGGVGGGSGATRKGTRAAAPASSSASITAKAADVTLEDLKNPNDKIDNRDNPADWTGKDIDIALNSLTNTGSLKGTLVAKGYDNLSGKSASHTTGNYQPQFASSTGWSSGNGVSLATLTDTPERINISEQRKNVVNLGDVNNSGSIVGDATIKGGTNTSHTATYSRSSGNGIGVYAGTGRNAKPSTEAHIKNITNSGEIMGSLEQISGQNSGFKSIHQVASAESYAGGNGVSVMAETDNAQVPKAQATLGNITNTGTISGKATVKSGSKSSGDLNLISYNTGNGISTYLKSSARSHDIGMGDIDNSGIIKGEIETEAGVATFEGDNSRNSGYYTPPKEEVKLIVWEQGGSLSNPPDVTPKKPANAPEVNQWIRPDPIEAQYSANSDVYGSGNGIAIAKHQNVTSKSSIGNITNKGVIGGQATMYHGYTKNGGYADVRFGNVGAGIAIDNALSSKVDNLGLISGNHAAMLASGNINTAFSLSDPTITPGYQKDNVNNYGLMAGTLIAGNYTNDGYAGGRNKQRYHYFEKPDSITNHGTYVYLKEGVTTTGTGYFASSKRNEDAGQIKEVKVASEQPTKKTIGTKEYTIINGAVNGAKTDSSHTPTNGTIENTIINGVGVAKGALIADKDLTLTGSIVNGYRTGLYIENDKIVTANNTLINTNPFKVNGQPTQAVLGAEGANTLIVSGGAVNGDINLQGGDDTLTIKDAMTRLNGKIDMGDGTDTVNFGTAPTDASDDAPMTFFGNITSAEKLNINAPTKLMPTSSIKGVDALTVNSTLYYPVDNIDGKQTHALNNTTIGTMTLSGTGQFLVETDKATNEVGFGTTQLQQNAVGSPTLAINSVVQNAVIKDGKLVIDTKLGQADQAVAGPGAGDTSPQDEAQAATPAVPADNQGSTGDAPTQGGTTQDNPSTAQGDTADTANNLAPSVPEGGVPQGNNQKTDTSTGTTAPQGGSQGTTSTPSNTGSQNLAGGATTQGNTAQNSPTSSQSGNQGSDTGNTAPQGGGNTPSSSNTGGTADTGSNLSSTSSQGSSQSAGVSGDTTQSNTAQDSSPNAQGNNQGASTSTGNTAPQGGTGTSAGSGSVNDTATQSSGTQGNAQANSPASTGGNTANQNTASPAKQSFKTPYVDAYNSYISSWKNGGTNFLKNSGRIDNKTESEATKAVNDYLGKTVEQNIYSALPKATLDTSRQYGQTLLADGKLLPVGMTDVAARVQTQSRSYNQVIDKTDSTNALFKTAYGVSDNLTVGGVLGYGNNQIIGKDGSALSGKGLYAGSYVATNVAKVDVVAGASYYRADLSGNRSIDNGFDRHKFDTKAGTVATTIYAQGKYDVPLAGELALSPKVGVMAHRFNFNGTQEQGVAALNVNQSTQNVVDAMVGVELSAQKALPTGMLSAKLSADYVNTLGGQPMTAVFQNGSSFALKQVSPAQTVRIGGRLGYQLNDKTRINANIDNDISSVGNALQGGVSVNYRF